MRNLFLALLTCAVLALTISGVEAAQLPQAPPNFAAPPAPAQTTPSLPQAPPNFAAPPAPAGAAPSLPAAPAGFGAPLATPTPIVTPAAANKPAPKVTSVRVVDGKVSVQATAVPLSQLVRLLDNAMGTNSGINSTLLSQSVSVRFDDLPYDAAVRKIFQGVPLDYIVIQDKGVFVTARSGAVANTSAPPGPTTTTAPPPIAPNEIFGGGPAPLPPGAVDPFATTAPNPSTPTPGATPPTPVTPPPGVPAVAPAIPDFNNPLSAPLPSFGAPAGAPPGGAPGGGLGGGTLIPFGQPIQ